MKPVLKTTDAVQLSFAQSVLSAEGIVAEVLDTHASIMDGSLGILPRRLVVGDEDYDRARRVLDAAMAAAGRGALATSHDDFLGGRLRVEQPLDGFRAGLDAVLLAAAVPEDDGGDVLELGSGAGTASLCLAHHWGVRGPGPLRVTGAEIDSDLVAIANRNAVANDMDGRVVFVPVDALDLPRDMRRGYGHVMLNPPFYAQRGTSEGAMADKGRARSANEERRSRALYDDGRLGDWLAAGLKRVAANGTLTAILAADRLPEAMAALPPAGLAVLPVRPFAASQAKRVVIRVRKGSRAPFALLPGLSLHEPDGTYAARAGAILRGEALLAPDFGGL